MKTNTVAQPLLKPVLSAVFVTMISAVAFGQKVDTPAPSQLPRMIRPITLLQPDEMIRTAKAEQSRQNAQASFAQQAQRGVRPQAQAETPQTMSERLERIRSQLVSGGVEPWNPETTSLNRCEQLVDIKASGAPRFSKEVMAAEANCNELIVDLIRNEALNTNQCDPDLTAMLRKQLIVNKQGHARLVLNVPDSESAQLAASCIGEMP